MLIKQLLKLNEGKVKEALTDLISYAVKHAPIGRASYESAIRIIIRFARQNDHDELLIGSPDSEVAEYVKAEFPKSEYDELREDAADDNWPKQIGSAGDFRVEVDENELVSLFDGRGAVKVSMPYVIWKQLTR